MSINKYYEQIRNVKFNFDSYKFERISQRAIDLLKKYQIQNFNLVFRLLNYPIINGGETINNNFISTLNLINYEADYLANIRSKNSSSQNSQEMVGSFALDSNNPAMNGKKDTFASLNTCSNTNIRPHVDKNIVPLSSKFS